MAYHYHPISLRDAMERISQRTESRRIFWEKTGRGNVNNRDCRGRLHRTLSQIKFWIYRQIGNTAGRWWNVPAVYAYLMDKALSEGLKNG